MTASKSQIRKHIWQQLREQNQARFPFPVEGRIPNFKGAEQAASRITNTSEWRAARVIKINPDSPQKKLRQWAMEQHKTLVVPTPRLQDGFLLLDNLSDRAQKAATIKGARQWGTKTPVTQIPPIDMIISGSVGVSKKGQRVGKGHGYSELEFAIAQEVNKITPETVVATTVHEIQIVEEIKTSSHDVPLDIIATPEKLIRVDHQMERPTGIEWDKITTDMLEEIPLLKKWYTAP